MHQIKEEDHTYVLGVW